MTKDLTKWLAFTLAEVLITLAIIGVVAGLTIPNLMQTYQQKVQKEQVRMVKYKLTQATSLMNTYGLIGPYNTTKDFVNELKKYMKLIKICESDNLQACWPTDKITVPDKNADGFITVDVKDLTNGTSISSLGLGTANTSTMGIVFADGTPMILTYSPYCTTLDQFKNYEYSLQDGKPVTNATTNCISAIFDINGSQKPNRIGTDVRTLNSLFGYKIYPSAEVEAATNEECYKLKKEGLVKYCFYEYNNSEYKDSYYKDKDMYAGAVKKCNDIHMHLPDTQTLVNIAGVMYGRTDITPLTTIYSNATKNEDWSWVAKAGGNLIYIDQDTIPYASSGYEADFDDAGLWGSEKSITASYGRDISSVYTAGNYISRDRLGTDVLCVGD